MHGPPYHAVLGVLQAGGMPSEGRTASDLKQANATGILKDFQLKMQAHEPGSMDTGACTAIARTLVLGAWGCADGRGKGIRLRRGDWGASHPKHAARDASSTA